MEIDLAPFQPTSQSAQPGVPTTVIAHKGDNLAGSEPMSGPNVTNNVNRQDKNPPFNDFSEHYINSFSKKEIDQFVPQSSKNGNGGSSKWEEKPQN